MDFGQLNFNLDPDVDDETRELRLKLNQLVHDAERSSSRHDANPDIEVQQEVRDIIKSALQVEDMATILKHQAKGPQTKNLKSKDLLYHSPPREPRAEPSKKPAPKA
jgi:hypothetical protein